MSTVDPNPDWFAGVPAGFRMQAEALDIAAAHIADEAFDDDPLVYLTQMAANLRTAADQWPSGASQNSPDEPDTDNVEVGSPAWVRQQRLGRGA